MACAVSGALTNRGRKDASRNDSCACSGRRGRSCRPILRLHAHGRLGWRRADLVRRRAAHSLVGHRGARDGRLMPSRPPLPGRRSHCRPRSSRRACRHSAGQIANRPCEGQWPDDALPLRGRRRGNPDSGLLRVAEVGRSFVRNGARRIGKGGARSLRCDSRLERHPSGPSRRSASTKHPARFMEHHRASVAASISGASVRKS